MESTEKRRGARILIVDREEPVARICLKALSHERFETQWVTTPEQAWELVETFRPQLYLIGDDFEEYLGLELCGQLRGRTNAPIIMLTPSDSVGYQINCLEAGADDVLIRPLSSPLLRAKCQGHMRRAYRYSVPPQAPRTRAPQAPGSVQSPLKMGQVGSANIFDTEALANLVSGPGQPGPGPVPSAGSGPAEQKPAAQATVAPVPPDGLPPHSNYRVWPRCEICYYIGPIDRFQGKDEHGRTIQACPACGETRLLRLPK